MSYRSLLWKSFNDDREEKTQLGGILHFEKLHIYAEAQFLICVYLGTKYICAVFDVEYIPA